MCGFVAFVLGVVDEVGGLTRRVPSAALSLSDVARFEICGAAAVVFVETVGVLTAGTPGKET